MCSTSNRVSQTLTLKSIRETLACLFNVNTYEKYIRMQWCLRMSWKVKRWNKEHFQNNYGKQILVFKLNEITKVIGYYRKYILSTAPNWKNCHLTLASMWFNFIFNMQYPIVNNSNFLSSTAIIQNKLNFLKLTFLHLGNNYSVSDRIRICMISSMIWTFLVQRVNIQRLRWLDHDVRMEEDDRREKRTILSTLQGPNGGNYSIVRCLQLKQACLEWRRLEGTAEICRNSIGIK